MREITRVVGKKPGSTSVVMAGVHGDEPCGMLAMKKMVETIEIESGLVYLIVGNPNAVADRKRQTEFNLNRAFKEQHLLREEEKLSYEGRRAEYLKMYLNEADALLDVHSSGTKGTMPFVICEQNGFDIAKNLPVSMIVSGFDAVCPGGTDEYMNRIGRRGLCIECGYHKDPKSVHLAKKAIERFLSTMGHIPFTQRIHRKQIVQKRIRVELIYRTKTPSFRLSKPWADFDSVRCGETIGFDGENRVRAERNAVILFPDDCATVGEEAFYLAYE